MTAISIHHPSPQQSLVKKAIFPVAGMGTRFLPATKASPKEMMPVVDKPLIQYAVEEAIAAGINELIFVTSSTKRAIEDHFDRNFELEAHLREKQKWESLKQIQRIARQGVSCIYIRQQEALGLGHAVLCAKDLINNEPFAVLLADDLIDAPHEPCLQQMARFYENGGMKGVLAVQEVLHSDVGHYGIASVDHQKQIKELVEKPTPSAAPSNLAVIGRYILPPAIFEALAHQEKGAGGEIQLTDAIASILDTHPIFAFPFEGVRYDCGDKLGYLKANLDFGLKHKECGKAWQSYLEDRFLGAALHELNERHH